MKKFMLTFAVILMAVFAASAQQSKTNDGANIKFDAQEHDYGTITQGANGDCVFKFKNSGNEPLIISDVRKSCGCTTPTWSKEPILPGQSGSIQVGYNTQIIGQFSKTITVLSNASNSPVTLTIKGNVTAKTN
jgi:hypothetical protein